VAVGHLGEEGLGIGFVHDVDAVADAFGVAEIDGLVLADNAGMLKLMKSLGFAIKRFPEDPDFKLVTHAL